MIYINARNTTGNKINIGIYRHPTVLTNNRFWHIQLDPESGNITSGGQLVTNLYDGFTDIDIYTLTTVYTPVLSGFRFSDICGTDQTTYILIADFGDPVSIGKYRLMVIDNATLQTSFYDIVDHGIDNGVGTYFGGAFFMQGFSGEWNNDIYLARESGGEWFCEKWRFSGNRFVKLRTIDRSNSIIMRPRPPIGCLSGGIEAIYAKGTWFNSFTNWDNEVFTVK
jgi:hypothetical protein